MLRRLASLSVRHRRLVLALWVIAIAGTMFAAGAFGGDATTDGRLPGTDSDTAYQLYTEHFPEDPAGSALMVFEDRRGIDAAAADIESFVAELRAIPGVTSVSSPLTDGQRSADGTVATGQVAFDIDDAHVDSVLEQITEVSDELRATGTQVDYSSFWFQAFEMPASESIGLIAAIVILLVAFGSVVAMGLPLVTAVAGIAIGLALVELWSAVVPTPGFTNQVASMVGIGVGIDYALFIVTRYRESLRRHSNVHDAIVEAIDTAGRAVVFAGVTVMISLMGMFLMGL